MRTTRSPVSTSSAPVGIDAGGRALVLAGGVRPGHRASDQPRGPHAPALHHPGEAAVEQVLVALRPRRPAPRRPRRPASGTWPSSRSSDDAAAFAVGQVLHVAHVDADADHHELRRLSDGVALGQHAGQLVAVEEIVGPLQRRLEPGRLADALGHRHAGGQGEQPEQARLAVGDGRQRRPHDGREVQPGVRRRRPAPATAPAAGGLMAGDDDQPVRPAGIGQRRRPVHRRGHRGGVGHRRRRDRRSAAARLEGASAKAAGSGSVCDHGGESGRERRDLEAEVHCRRRMRERAHRHHIGAGGRQLRQAIERDAARDLQPRPPGDPFDGAADVVGA